MLVSRTMMKFHSIFNHYFQSQFALLTKCSNFRNVTSCNFTFELSQTVTITILIIFNFYVDFFLCFLHCLVHFCGLQYNIFYIFSSNSVYQEAITHFHSSSRIQHYIRNGFNVLQAALIHFLVMFMLFPDTKKSIFVHCKYLFIK